MRRDFICILLLSGLAVINRPDNLGKPSQYTLDLTAPVPESQKGRSDMPGSGATWRTGQKPSRYQLPLGVRILNSSIDADGDAILEILLANVDDSSVEMPISRDVSRVEETPGESRSLFVLRAVPVYEGQLGSDSIGFGETAGSPNIEGSLMRLEPGKSIRVLIRLSAASLKRSLPKNRDRVEVRIVCAQWRLDNQRFFIEVCKRRRARISRG